MPIFEVEHNGKSYEIDAPDQATALSALPKSGPQVGMGESAARGALQGATMDFGDELAGAAAASPIPRPGPQTTFGNLGAIDVLAGGARMLLNKAGIGSGASTDYTAERDRLRATNEAAQKQNPVSYGAGQVGGALTTALIPGLNVAKGASLGRQVGQGAAVGTGFGALQGAGGAKELADVPKDAAVGGAVGLGMGALAPVLARGASRIISPLQATPERQALTDVLKREGIDLTAGQKTGSKPLQWLESTLGDMPGAGGKASDIQNRQGQQFTAAALRRTGTDAPLATPQVIDEAFTRMGKQFDDLASRNTMQMDQKFAQDFGGAVQDYVGLVSPGQRAPIVAKVIDDVLGIAKDGGAMDGAAYQVLRSRLEKAARGTADPELGKVLRNVKNALDDAMERSIPASSPDAAAWREVRKQYRNMIPIEKAATGAGERAAEGYLSPALLRSQVANQSRRNYARGSGDLAELARAGTVMNPLPNSGTAPRAWAQGLLSGGAGGVGAMSGDPMTALAMMAAPSVAGRVLMSRPVQGYLANQAGSRIAPKLGLLAAHPLRQQAVDVERRRGLLAGR